MRDELSNQKLTDQPFLCEVKIDLDGKLVETIMPNKDIEAFENYLESIDEPDDEGSVIVQEADIFKETDKKHLMKSNEVNMVKELIILIKTLLDIKVGIVTYQVIVVVAFLVDFCSYA